jgi:AraC-like DNA-binding protein
MDPGELPMELDELYPDSLRAQSRTFSYHIRGEREENSNIHIAGMGLHERMKPCWNTRPRGNPDYLCLYFYDPVEFFLDGDRVSSPENKWIILTPERPHSYGHDSAFWDHSWLHISGGALEQSLEDIGIPRDRFVDTGGPELFETLLQRLHEELYYNSRPRFDILEFELKAGLARLDRKINHPESKVPAIYRQIRLKLDCRYDRNFSLEGLAEEAGCSQAVFCRSFKAYFHSSPIDYLIDRRIDIACHLLRTTDHSIAELGERVGYPDMYYFSRIFKKRKGCSPRAFRNNFINN